MARTTEGGRGNIRPPRTIKSKRHTRDIAPERTSPLIVSYPPPSRREIMDDLKTAIAQPTGTPTPTLPPYEPYGSPTPTISPSPTTTQPSLTVPPPWYYSTSTPRPPIEFIWGGSTPRPWHDPGPPTPVPEYMPPTNPRRGGRQITEYRPLGQNWRWDTYNFDPQTTDPSIVDYLLIPLNRLRRVIYDTLHIDIAPGMAPVAGGTLPPRPWRTPSTQNIRSTDSTSSVQPQYGIGSGADVDLGLEDIMYPPIPPYNPPAPAPPPRRRREQDNPFPSPMPVPETPGEPRPVARTLPPLRFTTRVLAVEIDEMGFIHAGARNQAEMRIKDQKRMEGLRKRGLHVDKILHVDANKLLSQEEADRLVRELIRKGR